MLRTSAAVAAMVKQVVGGQDGQYVVTPIHFAATTRGGAREAQFCLYLSLHHVALDTPHSSPDCLRSPQTICAACSLHALVSRVVREAASANRWRTEQHPGRGRRASSAGQNDHAWWYTTRRRTHPALGLHLLGRQGLFVECAREDMRRLEAGALRDLRDGRAKTWFVTPFLYSQGLASRLAGRLTSAAEILLVGTGERAEMMPPALRQYLSKAGVQIDVMNTVSPPYSCQPGLTPYVRHSEMRVQPTTY